MNVEPTESSSRRGVAWLLWVLRWILLLTPFVFAWRYPILRSEAVVRWGQVSCFFAAVGLVTLYVACWLLVGRALARRGVAPAADVGLRPPGRQVWLLGLAVGAIFCWSVAGYVEYFPAAIDGEANDAIRSAQSLVQGLEKGLF